MSVAVAKPQLTMAPSHARPGRAPRPIPPSTQKATRPSTAIPQYLIDEASETPQVDFDASTHLNYQKPSNILTMKEIGLEGQGISPNAVSDPFPLFTQDAIMQMRREVFSPRVLDECQYTSTFIKHMVRGMDHERAPFTYEAWKSPELIKRVSEVAGVDLVPHFDHDIANVNITWTNQATGPKKMEGEDAPEAAAAEKSEQQQQQQAPLDDTNAVAWHHDSFPVVCVVMLSDCTGMVGGETALRLPSGEIRKARGPTMGTAVVMQGRYIEHQALKALGGRERISMVTCFRPRDPMVRDETVLVGVRAISDLPLLYDQYVEYRLELLEERFRIKGKEERKRREVRGKGAKGRKMMDIDDMRAFLLEQKEYLDDMLDELI